MARYEWFRRRHSAYHQLAVERRGSGDQAPAAERAVSPSGVAAPGGAISFVCSGTWWSPLRRLATRCRFKQLGRTSSSDQMFGGHAKLINDS